ncbi:putative asparaginase 2 [Tieghemostelium lacteum]|uniref:beta-aspartyl-peptidase n=1 Tax=Tieghemostelium lacteum TaxID=361077 RepID=A0A151Z9I0_TIELA|nr:putative asparaginase 2 [Tieghemostelium lacteum]|eukprot:KYQ90583.1 putative asparaginase 2 [Tieghemostelium lacteum]
MSNKSIIVIHGGAGTINQSSMTNEKEKEIRHSLSKILLGAKAVLENGGTAIEAVTEAVRLLEDDEIYNAGKGSVFTDKFTNEMDASIMDGKTLKAGSVCGVATIKNPIKAAKALMEYNNNQTVMLSGEPAQNFAKSQGVEIVDPSYFYTAHRYNQCVLAKEKAANKAILDHDGENNQIKQKQEESNVSTTTTVSVSISNGDGYPLDNNKKHGTVGAVALDQYGNLASATSTGGMTNKKSGRIGDSPIIGAGCYSNNNTCAVSTTGTGESFIRAVVAYDLSAMLEYTQMSLEEAGNKVIHTKLPLVDGDGGLIAVDKNGNFIMPFNTEGMYRGYMKVTDIEPNVFIYKN